MIEFKLWRVEVKKRNEDIRRIPSWPTRSRRVQPKKQVQRKFSCLFVGECCKDEQCLAYYPRNFTSFILSQMSFAKRYLHHIFGKTKHDAKPGVHDADHRRVVAHCAGVYEAGSPKQKLEKDVVPVSRKSRNIPSQTTRHS